ncbi:MAG: protein-tyrosine-phosphatase [Bacteroidota bacterium]
MFNDQNKISFPIKLFGYIKNLEKGFEKIPDGRKNKLLLFSKYLSEKLKKGEDPTITVICTHNSRRSHIGQIWLKTAAIFYGKDNIRVFSGGTEATAFHPNAVNALRKVGFDIKKTGDSDNPFYECEIGTGGPVLILFSKKYEDDRNPQKDFAALMVCNEADEACPVVIGAEARFPITYKDPKAFDGTDQEEEKYLERVEQIGREMFFVISQI